MIFLTPACSINLCNPIKTLNITNSVTLTVSFGGFLSFGPHGTHFAFLWLELTFQRSGILCGGKNKRAQSKMKYYFRFQERQDRRVSLCFCLVTDGKNSSKNQAKGYHNVFSCQICLI